MVLVGAIVAALVVGFLAGLMSFKKSEEYCPDHGVTRTCSICLRTGVIYGTKS